MDTAAFDAGHTREKAAAFMAYNLMCGLLKAKQKREPAHAAH